ncbi:hypothetical protein [Actinomadura sp. 3N407]|uniref:hypothetical protein n=1 Tax=Actinomadura sp. 3N407 TaxID=3457423 RepID=UPI003FCD929D
MTAADVEAFRAALGNAYLIYDGAVVRVVPQVSAERDYPGAFVITTRQDLPALDPGAEVYPASFLAELLTAFADDRYAEHQKGLK